MTKKVVIASSGSGFSSISQKYILEQFKSLPPIDIGIDEIENNSPRLSKLSKHSPNKRNFSTNKYTKKRA